jgi:hypothetical protein
MFREGNYKAKIQTTGTQSFLKSKVVISGDLGRQVCVLSGRSCDLQTAGLKPRNVRWNTVVVLKTLSDLKHISQAARDGILRGRGSHLQLHRQCKGGSI